MIQKGGAGGGSVDTAPHADIRHIVDFGKIAPLNELQDAAHQVYEADHAVPDYDLNVKHNIRPVVNQILNSINDIYAGWTHLECYHGFTWPRLIDSVRESHDKLQPTTVRDDNVDAFLFKPPPLPIDSATTDPLF